MKKLFINLFILALIIFVLDRCFGFVLEKYFYKQTHGDDYVSIALLENKNTDVIILGSSRASHHYISDSIAKYTGLTTFNGGRDNMGIHYIAAVLPEILKRYTPKNIILDLIPNNFYKGAQDNQKYFDIQSNALLPFANRHPAIYNCINNFNSQEVVKAKLLKTYAYNSLIGSIFQNTYTSLGHVQANGYEPLYHNLDTVKYNKPISNEDNLLPILDTTALHLFEKTIQLCNEKHIKVIVVFSPFYFYRKTKIEVANAFQQYANQYQFTLLDFSTDTNYVHHPNLFYDELHLNNVGANVLSKEVSKYLK